MVGTRLLRKPGKGVVAETSELTEAMGLTLFPLPFGHYGAKVIPEFRVHEHGRRAVGRFRRAVSRMFRLVGVSLRIGKT